MVSDIKKIVLFLVEPPHVIGSYTMVTFSW